ncbi:MAG TPA: ORF6N domain-containing protein [Candidatus Omnitrophota bacterium]|nr:ORF6N domain-containing protein [Candidatus Omnitrophota bacterium]
MSKTSPANPIEPKIHLIRGQRVMLDHDLAELYGVETKVLKQTIKRNRERFPSDFMLELTPQELQILRSQIVTSSWGGHRYLPFAFTEQGVSMLSSVLKSKRAIQVNIEIMRTFVRIRQIALTHQELSAKLSALESKVGKHDEDIQGIIRAIQRLLIQEEKPKRRMGFHPD